MVIPHKPTVDSLEMVRQLFEAGFVIKFWHQYDSAQSSGNASREICVVKETEAIGTLQ
jgi:hypothetical protein